MSPQILLFFLSIIPLLFTTISAIEFIFNTDFNSTNVLTYGNATIQSSILTLTNETTFSIGRGLYPSKIFTKNPNSSFPLPFSTSFIFSIVPYPNVLPGHGFAFLFVPFTGIDGASSAQHLGLFNLTNNDGNPNNHIFAIEFDVFNNQEFNDSNDNHVGIDINSLTSFTSHVAGFWDEKNNEKFHELKLNNGVNYQVWIDYDSDSRINVTMARVGRRRPTRPLISAFVNLTGVLLDEMYVGFGGATGRLVQAHKILAWSFSNSNFSIGDALITDNLPSFVIPKKSVSQSLGFIVGVSVGSVFIVVCIVVVYVILVRRRKGADEEIEDWELEYWPHRMNYQEISAAVKGFAEENVIGVGGNGKVYKGVLAGGAEVVAVKRISHASENGMREFCAEISSLGRLKHRNLVGLRGWCKIEKGSLILVYNYMENGSLDKWIFECEESKILNWEERIKVLKDVASGILYLHYGWEAKVLHRDIKASNVLLDKDMNARLGDFGLARMHDHEQLSSTTRVVGTVGYMAPEVIRTGRASVQTDVFGFGILVLEVMCGRRPLEEGKPGLIEWVWGLMEQNKLVCALDERLKAKGGYSDAEAERMLHLGLLCTYPNPRVRLTMKQVVEVLEGANEVTESEEEGMELNLLYRMQSTTMWSRLHRSFSGSGHPTFDQIRQTLSTSTTLSTSDILVKGR